MLSKLHCLYFVDESDSGDSASSIEEAPPKRRKTSDDKYARDVHAEENGMRPRKAARKSLFCLIFLFSQSQRTTKIQRWRRGWLYRPSQSIS